MKFAQQNRGLLLVIGLVAGCVVGLNLRGLLPSVPLHATATQGFDNFAIATGLVGDRVEGLYFLDYLTGDLICAVIDPKTGKFNSRFTYNVAADFGGAAGKNPKYLMVTGLASMRRGRANFQFGNSIVYIAEATSGQIAAYGVPWNSSMQAAGKPQIGAFLFLDKQPFRSTFVRDQ